MLPPRIAPRYFYLEQKTLAHRTKNKILKNYACPQLDPSSSLWTRRATRICLGGRKGGNLGVVGKSKNFAAPRSFKLAAHRGRVCGCLKTWPFPIIGRDDGLALAIAGFTVGPPIPEPFGYTAPDEETRDSKKPRLMMKIGVIIRELFTWG